MKKYKDFKDIVENFDGVYNPSTTVQDPEAQDSTANLNDLGDPEAMGAVNAFIKQFTENECMNPRQRVAQLRTRLNTVGLHFDFNHTNGIVEGSEDYPLTLHGGRYGFVDIDGVVKEDDGISPKLGYGLALRVNYAKQESGLYRVEASIIKQEESE
tara:strand:- start:1153 stop:1620 length:468 start_codon:yes stop_codon:yes gene_type:complete